MTPIENVLARASAGLGVAHYVLVACDRVSVREAFSRQLLKLRAVISSADTGRIGTAKV